MLTAEQRAELDEWGLENVRSYIAQFGVGPGASIPGFKCGDIMRSDISDWLSEQHQQDERRQSSILWWAKVAAVASIIGVAVGIIALFVQK